MLRRIFVVGGSGAIGALMLAIVQIRVGALFGAGPELDAFFVGAALPSMLLAISAGAIFSIVIPRLPADGSGPRVAGRFAALAALGGVGIGSIVALAATPIVDLVAPGLDQDTASRAVEILRIYSITLGPTSVAFVFSAYAYSIDRSFVAGASTACYGLAWFVLLFFAPFRESVAGVAVAGVLATGVQVGSAFLLAMLRGTALRPSLRELGVSRGAVVAAATVLGATVVSRLVLLFDPLFGSLLEAGSISELTYASRIMLLAVFFSGQGAAFSLLVVGRNRDERSDADARIGLIVPLLLSLGAAVIFAICGTGLAVLLLARGEITTGDAQQVGELLRLYAPAIVAITMIWALEAMLYAAKRGREVLERVAAGLVLNLAASAALVALLGVEGRPLGVLIGVGGQLALLLVLMRDDARVSTLRDATTRDRAARLVAVTAIVAGAIYLIGAELVSTSAAAAVAAVATAAVTVALVVGFERERPAVRGR